MKVKSPGTLLNTIIIYVCLSFQKGAFHRTPDLSRAPLHVYLLSLAFRNNQCCSDQTANSIRSVGKQLQQQQQLRNTSSDQYAMHILHQIVNSLKTFISRAWHCKKRGPMEGRIVV